MKYFRPCLRSSTSREISTSTVHDLAQKTPLSEALPGLPQVVYGQPDWLRHETRVTVMENGLRVASENMFGKFCTIGGISIFVATLVQPCGLNSFFSLQLSSIQVRDMRGRIQVGFHISWRNWLSVYVQSIYFLLFITISL